MADVVNSLSEIAEIERAHALGAPTLGRAAAALIARWQLSLHDDETFLRLAFLSWFSEHEPAWLTGLEQSLPRVDSLIAEYGGAEALSPEARFTLAMLWSVFPPLGADEDEYRERAIAWAERAALESPDSRLFREWRYFLHEADDTEGARVYIDQELHARYSGRGALGEYVVHMLRTRLRPGQGPSVAS